jgi:hypothetical protein
LLLHCVEEEENDKLTKTNLTPQSPSPLSSEADALDEIAYST